jgi:hypothetical protein
MEKKVQYKVIVSDRARQMWRVMYVFWHRKVQLLLVGQKTIL